MSTVTKSVPGDAVCGPNGKPIAFPEDMQLDMFRVVYLVKERFNRSYTVERGEDGDGQVYMVPVDPENERPLTVPERAAIEMISWYCREYTGDFRRTTSVTFPKIIHDQNEEPFSFCDEARAYMFAEVAESVFDVDAQVIETTAGWAVAVSNDRRSLNAEELAHLQGACRVLMDFTVEAADMVCASESSNYMRHIPAPESRAAWRDRKNAPLARIEKRLDALGNQTTEILQTLDYIFEKHFRPLEAKPADGDETAAAPAEEPELSQKPDRQDCLILPYIASTKDKAEQLADAIDALFFFGVETQVFEDCGKWGIAIIGGADLVGDVINNKYIESAAILLIYYDLTNKEDDSGTLECVADLLKDVPSAHEALTKRARRQFRIENKLDDILSRLDQNVTTGAETALVAAGAQPDSSGKNGRRSA